MRRRIYWYLNSWSIPGNSVVKNPPAMQEMWVWPLDWEDPLEKEMVTLAWGDLMAGYSPWVCRRVRHELNNMLQYHWGHLGWWPTWPMFLNQKCVAGGGQDSTAPRKSPSRSSGFAGRPGKPATLCLLQRLQLCPLCSVFASFLSHVLGISPSMPNTYAFLTMFSYLDAPLGQQLISTESGIHLPHYPAQGPRTPRTAQEGRCGR